MYAIVKTGGKQYKVAPGEKLNIEKLDAEVGEDVILPVLMVVDGDKVITDADALAGYQVNAKVVEQFKADKVFVVKFHKRKNYKRKNGHRQLQTRVEISSIAPLKAAKKSSQKAEKVVEAPETAE